MCFYESFSSVMHQSFDISNPRSLRSTGEFNNHLVSLCSQIQRSCGPVIFHLDFISTSLPADITISNSDSDLFNNASYYIQFNN